MQRIHSLWATMGSAAVVAALTAVPPPAHAQTSVGCSADDLVTAITNANSAGGDTLDLAPNCVYTLTAPNTGADGLPPITSTITINGDGATITRANGSAPFRILDVQSSGNLTASDLTVSNGNPVGEGAPNFGSAGGILVLGSLTLDAVTVSGNASSTNGGGGVGVFGTGTATIGRSTITGNTTAGFGGGLALEGRSTTVTGSFVTGNTAVAAGGIEASLGDVTLNSTDVRSNSAQDYAGGIGDDFSTLTVSRSNIRNNTVTGAGEGDNSGGAGIRVTGGTFNGRASVANLSDSTVSGNTATAPGTTGGGIKNFGTLHLTRTAVMGNASAGAPGGIYNGTNPDSSVTLSSSAVFSNRPTNCVGSPGAVPGCFG